MMVNTTSLHFIIPTRLSPFGKTLLRSAVRRGTLPGVVCCRHNSTASSASPTTSSKLPAHIPSQGCVNLDPSRALFGIHGVHAAKFIQGLITQTFPPKPEQIGMFTSFLSPQGRVLFDAFIYSTDPSFVGVEPSHPSPMYLIEVDRSRIFSLKWHFDRYKLRNKFRTYEIPASQIQIFSVWPALPAHAPNAESVEIVDPRSPHLGTRMLTKKPPSIEPFPMEVYDIRRTLHGVPEGAEEIIPESALPAESNLDVMSGIDFTKGCYIGQELTSRTYHTGIIRKRLLPLSLFPANGEVPEPMTLAYDSALSLDLPPSGTSFTAAGERRSPGKFLRGWGNIGWGLVRLDYVGKVLKCDWEGGSVLAKPFLPEWAETEKDTGTVEPLPQETLKDAVKYGHPDEI